MIVNRLNASLLVLSFALASCCGCGREESTILVRIDGAPLTVADVKRAVRVQARIVELSGSPVSADKFTDWANKTAMRMLVGIINSRLLCSVSQKEGILSTKEDHDRVLASYNRQTGLNASTREKLADEFGELRDEFLREFGCSVQIAAYERVHWTASVPDAMIRQQFVAMSNDLKRARQIDAAAHEKAAWAYQRLKAGEKWAKVAAECSEDKIVNPANERYEHEWLAVGPDALGIKALASALPNMKKGDFTAPIETGEGLIIFRFLGRVAGSFTKLSRILFRLSRPIRIETDVEKVREELAKSLRSSARRDSISRLRAEASFEYPAGTNFTCQIWGDWK